MITFTSRLWVWKGEGSRWFFVTVPEEEAAEIKARAFSLPRGFGSVRVDAMIGDVVWRTSVFPQNSGGYLLPVKAAVRKQAGLSEGDEVTVELTILD